MNIKESSKNFAKFAKKENRLSEKFSLKFPHHLEWKDEVFNENKQLIALLIGRF